MMANSDKQYCEEKLDDWVKIDKKDLEEIDDSEEMDNYYLEEVNDSEDENQELFLNDIETDEVAGIMELENRAQIPKHKSHAEDYCKYPDYIKPKENMEIGDVVRDLALPFLPAKSLCRFRTVSKGWNEWLKSPFLAHKQATQFKDVSGLFCQYPGESPSFISLNPDAYGIPMPSLNFLPEIVDIKATCNGLLCCRGRGGDNAYYICNPVTKEWRMLPNSILYHGPDTAVALAFKPSALNFTPSFQLICAVTVPDSTFKFFEIYSSRSFSWRICETVCSDLSDVALKDDGFYFEGFVYWETQIEAALVFDVYNEVYGLFSLPFESGPAGVLTEMHGEVCYLMPRVEDNEYSIEVYGNMNMELKQLIPLNLQLRNVNELCRVLGFVKDDTFIIALGSTVIAYHSREQKVEWLHDTGTHQNDQLIQFMRNYGYERTYGYAQFLPYVNSLVHVGHSSISSLLNLGMIQP